MSALPSDQSLYELVLDFQTDVTADVQRQINPLGVDASVEVFLHEHVHNTPVRFRGSFRSLMIIAARHGMKIGEFREAVVLLVEAPHVTQGRDEV